MDWNAIISAFGNPGQVVILALVTWLIWARMRDQRERRVFEQRMEERMQQLLEYTVRRAIDSAIPDNKSGDD